MTEEEKNQLFSDINELNDIFDEFSPIQNNNTFLNDAIKPCCLEMINFIMFFNIPYTFVVCGFFCSALHFLY